MNTTTTRARAGKPYVMPLHRAMPIDFVLPDEDAERAGFDAAMKAPIQKPQHVETASVEDTESIAWFGWLLASCLLCVIFAGIGFVVGRYFS